MSALHLEQEAYAIRGAVFEVSREMGIGFLEAVYQECLEKEFRHQSIPYARHPNLKLAYKGDPLVQIYTPDFICFGKIIIELKVAENITDGHKAQIINYLKATKLQLGLLVNFGAHPKAQIERFAL